MNKFFRKSLIAAAVSILALPAIADTTGGNTTVTSAATIPASGYTQVAQLVQNMAGQSVSQSTSGLLTLKDATGATILNGWNAAAQIASSSAGQVVKQDGIAKVTDGVGATVGATTGTGAAVQSTVLSGGATFALTSKVADATAPSGFKDVAGGASLFSQVSHTNNAGQVQATNPDGSLKVDAAGKPVMIDTTSTAGYVANIGPTGAGSDAYFGTNQKLNQDLLVGASGQTVGMGSLSLTGDQTSIGGASTSGTLSAPVTGAPSATVSAVMTAGHTTNLTLATAVSGGTGLSMGSFVSQNKSSVDQTYIVGTRTIVPPTPPVTP